MYYSFPDDKNGSLTLTSQLWSHCGICWVSTLTSLPAPASASNLSSDRSTSDWSTAAQCWRGLEDVLKVNLTGVCWWNAHLWEHVCGMETQMKTNTKVLCIRDACVYCRCTFKLQACTIIGGERQQSSLKSFSGWRFSLKPFFIKLQHFAS